MTKQRMSQKPDPGVPGESIKVTYDLTDCTVPIELTVHGDPCGSKSSVVIRGVEDAEFELQLPAGCTGGIITDLSGQSMDYTIAISPP